MLQESPARFTAREKRSPSRVNLRFRPLLESIPRAVALIALALTFNARSASAQGQEAPAPVQAEAPATTERPSPPYTIPEDIAPPEPQLE